MSGLHDENGTVHIPSDELVSSACGATVFALCDVARHHEVTDETYEVREWDAEQIDVDAMPNCLACIAALHWLVSDERT